MRPSSLAAVPLAGAALLLVAGPASAAEHHSHVDGHHVTAAEKAERKAARVAARQAAHDAVKNGLGGTAAGGTYNPTPTPTPTSPGHQAPGSPIHGTPCTVTATRPAPGSDVWHIVNGCAGPVTLTEHVQSQPSLWEKGLCKEHPGTCHLVVNKPITVPPGPSDLTIALPSCGYFQVDLIGRDGHLIRAGHYRTTSGCKQPHHPGHVTPGTPILHDGPKPSKPTVPTVALVTTSEDIPALPRTGVDVTDPVQDAVLALAAGGVLMFLGRKPRKQARAWRAAIGRTRSTRRARVAS